VPVHNARAVIGKLNPACRRALEAAAGLCVSSTHYLIEVEHWLVKLIEATDTDLPRLFRHYEVDLSRVVRELTRALDAMKRGNVKVPSMSSEVCEWVSDAWLLASLEYGEGLIRTSHLLCALMTNRTFGARVRAASPELARIPADGLQRDLPALVNGSPEDAHASAAGQAAPQRPNALAANVAALCHKLIPLLDQLAQELARPEPTPKPITQDERP
jgi:type VI secretion system protein VasG